MWVSCHSGCLNFLTPNCNLHHKELKTIYRAALLEFILGGAARSAQPVHYLTHTHTSARALVHVWNAALCVFLARRRLSGRRRSSSCCSQRQDNFPSNNSCFTLRHLLRLRPSETAPQTASIARHQTPEHQRNTFLRPGV